MKVLRSIFLSSYYGDMVEETKEDAASMGTSTGESQPQVISKLKAKWKIAHTPHTTYNRNT